MAALNPGEKAAGRRFRDEAQAELSKTFRDDPPTYTVPNVLALFRHACPKRRNTSTALELKEVYISSKCYSLLAVGDELFVTSEDNSALPAGLTIPGGTVVGVGFVPAGRFAFLYRAGTCRGCGQTARSKEGRIVDAWERPPIHGRVARS